MRTSSPTPWIPLLGLVLVGCNPPAGEKCSSGVREAFDGAVPTPEGEVALHTTQCVTISWSDTLCEAAAGPAWCRYFFEPNTPASAPPELIYGDFVFRHAFGHLELSPPEAIAGTQDIRVALETLQGEKVAAGYRATPVQPTTMFDGSPAFGLTLSCDHPDIDPICPFTWAYLYVDLDGLAPGLYADFSAQYAAFYDAGNAAEPVPEEFAAYDEMVRTITLELP